MNTLNLGHKRRYVNMQWRHTKYPVSLVTGEMEITLIKYHKTATKIRCWWGYKKLTLIDINDEALLLILNKLKYSGVKVTESYNLFWDTVSE